MFIHFGLLKGYVDMDCVDLSDRIQFMGIEHTNIHAVYVEKVGTTSRKRLKGVSNCS